MSMQFTHTYMHTHMHGTVEDALHVHDVYIYTMHTCMRKFSRRKINMYYIIYIYIYIYVCYII